jgi:hypoxanthine phosphoribosyltransferase
MGMRAGRVLLTAAQIEARVGELAEQISRDYAGREPLLVGVLAGAFVFLADLARRLTIPVAIDFFDVSSYGQGTRSSGEARILRDLEISITGRDLLLVEDIVDTGLTLKCLLGHIETRRPASLRTCVLLDKVSARRTPLTLDYVGFHVPDVFVVGYGLDHAGRYRHLPDILALDGEEDAEG